MRIKDVVIQQKNESIIKAPMKITKQSTNPYARKIEVVIKSFMS